MNTPEGSSDNAFHLHQKLGLWGGLAASIGIFLFANLDPAHPAVTSTAAVAVLMAVWWITDALPLAVTSLLPLILFPALGIMSGKEVATKYFDDVICLYLGGFLVAIAMERWDLHRRIALRILLWFGLKPRMILLGFMAATGFISMWISNTASAMMMVPIGVAILMKLEELSGERMVRGYGTALLLGIAYAASIGGIATKVGSPTNLVFFGIYAKQFPAAAPVTFLQWMVFALPLAILMMLSAWLIMTAYFRLSGKMAGVDASIFRNEHAALGPMTWAQKVVAVDFAVLAVLWMTRSSLEVGSFHFKGWSEFFPDAKFITDGSTAMALSVPLFLVPARAAGSRRILEESAIEKIPWGVVLLFGGGFALAAAFESSGLSTWVGSQLSILKGIHPFLIIVGVCCLTTFLTELTSNTATATVLLPILAVNAKVVGIDPMLLMIPAVLCASFAFMLPVGTPPNAIVFGTRRVSMQHMVRVGILINVAGIILTAVMMWVMGPAVFGVTVK